LLLLGAGGWRGVLLLLGPAAGEGIAIVIGEGGAATILCCNFDVKMNQSRAFWYFTIGFGADGESSFYYALQT
jgi:hypothetical protein